MKKNKMKRSKYISAYYEDDNILMDALKKLKEKGIQIGDVLTPFPVHGIDKVLGYRRSWIPRIGFIGGAVGAVCGFVFQAWVFTEAYPLNIGGKPFLSIPSFIPVTFECTVLFAAFAMVIAFLVRSGLGPGANNIIHDERITDDRFIVLLNIDGANEKESIKTLSDELKALGAKGIKVNKPE